MFAVGGADEAGKDTKLIYRYDRESNWWKEVGEMPTARQLVLAGILPDARVMCIGGQSEASKDLRVVEIGLMKELVVDCDLDEAQAPGRARSCNVM